MKHMSTTTNFELLKVRTDKNQNQTINGRALHEFLEVNTPYAKWFGRMCEYGFEEDVDYWTVDKNVHRADGTLMPQKEKNHILILDTAKEICMLQRSEKGRQARQYFIQVEKNYKKLLKENQDRYIARRIGIEIRKTMTDAIKEVIPETPHKKFTYKNYTELAYKIIFNKNTKQLKEYFKLTKQDNLRNYFNSESLRKVEMIENLIKTYLYAGLDYKQIKNVLYSTFPNGVKLVCSLTDNKEGLIA